MMSHLLDKLLGDADSREIVPTSSTCCAPFALENMTKSPVLIPGKFTIILDVLAAFLFSRSLIFHQLFGILEKQNQIIELFHKLC